MGVKRLVDTGAIPFETVVGTPAARYGPRLTFRPDGAAGFSGLDEFHDHPWGPPDWVGVRVGADRRLRLKGYHARVRERTAALEPPGLPADLNPVLAARDGDAEEVYWRWRGRGPWDAFAVRCAAVVGAPPPICAPHPWPVQTGFAVSVRRECGEVTAVTVFADSRCLPDDRTVAREWTADMAAGEQRAYEASLAGVRSFGPRVPGGWHGMLGWTLERGGGAHRAASLHVPGGGG